MKRWADNIEEWIRMDIACSTRTAKNRTRWKGVVTVICDAPTTVYDRMGSTVEYCWLLEPNPMVRRIRILIYPALPV